MSALITDKAIGQCFQALFPEIVVPDHKSSHWSSYDSGTGITNFSPRELPVYILSVQKYNARPTACKLVVSLQHTLRHSAMSSDYSLHYKPGFDRTAKGLDPDLSVFWSIFSNMAKETP